MRTAINQGQAAVRLAKKAFLDWSLTGKLESGRIESFQKRTNSISKGVAMARRAAAFSSPLQRSRAVPGPRIRPRQLIRTRTSTPGLVMPLIVPGGSHRLRIVGIPMDGDVDAP